MKKKLFSLLLSCCISCNIFATGTVLAAESVQTPAEANQPSPIDNFRGYKWGTSRSDIEAGEITDNMVEGIDYIYSDSRDTLAIVNGSVAGYDTFVYYTFDDSDEFVQGFYILQEEHSNKTDYYDDFCDLAELYVKKYGQPLAEKEDWKDDLFKDDPSEWGTAIAAGYVEFSKLWKDSDGNSIVMVLSGDNYEISTNILYVYAGYEAEENMEGI